MDGKFSAHPKCAERFSKALLSSIFGHFCWALIAFLFAKKFFCVLKKPFGPFWMCHKTFLALSEPDGPIFRICCK
jgi:hypothetical protein